ncbi:acyl-CoA thioesterase/BAAT N-terminal domain-containing protein [Leifsonia sp. McL0607]|uniref:acyl-CoA thioesterase/bile acid-CoA:amino acid N-acyltransferase family protein n=1 Tax=Leifsonia sp. McL0607 TaxID=3415672 RepID=UPI003CEAA8B2
MARRGEEAGRVGRTTRVAALRAAVATAVVAGLALAAALSGCATVEGQVGPRFVTPPLIRFSSVLWPVPLQLVGAQPGTRLRITASLTSARGTWTSGATYDVGGDGTIDFARDRPQLAPFVQPDSAGLFWSLRGPSLGPADLAQQWMRDTSPVTLTAADGNRVVARRTFRLQGLAATSRADTVYTHDLAPENVGSQPPPHETHEDEPVGTFWSAASIERPTGPAVLMFDDPSPGASSAFTAPVLSQFGASVFVIPISSSDGVHVSTVIDSGTVSAVLDWLDHRTGVDPRHIFVYGTGAAEQLAVWAATTFPRRLHGLFGGGGASSLLCLAGSSASPVFAGSVGLPCEREPGPVTAPPSLQEVAGPVVLSCGRDDVVFPRACGDLRALARTRTPRAGDELLIQARAAHAVTVPPGLPIALPIGGDASGADAQSTQGARIAFWDAVGQQLLRAVLS